MMICILSLFLSLMFFFCVRGPRLPLSAGLSCITIYLRDFWLCLEALITAIDSLYKAYSQSFIDFCSAAPGTSIKHLYEKNTAIKLNPV